MTVKEAQDAAREAAADPSTAAMWALLDRKYLESVQGMILHRASNGGLDLLLDAAELWTHPIGSRQAIEKALQDEGYKVTLTYAHLMISWNPDDADGGAL